MAAHKHAEVIKAWADGAQIQYKTHHDEVFKDWIGTPSWSDNVEYRIKPAESEREPYPETQMSCAEFSKALGLVSEYSADREACEKVANAALRHACDNRQIVTRAEFDRAVGDRQKRDMAVAEAVRDAAASKTNGAWDSNEEASVACTVWNRIKDELDLKMVISQLK